MCNRRCATPCLHSLFLQILRLQFLLRHQPPREDAKGITLFLLVGVPAYSITGLSVMLFPVTCDSSLFEKALRSKPHIRRVWKLPEILSDVCRGFERLPGNQSKRARQNYQRPRG